MTRSLRQRHREIVLALGVLVPAAFATGLAVRKPIPVVPALPSGVVEGTQRRTVTIWTRDDAWESGSIRTRLIADVSDPARFAIELAPKAEVVHPDILVYWVGAERKLQDSLPEDAYLLGALAKDASMPVILPPGARLQNGRLILYSLADHEIINITKPLALK